MGLDGSKFVRSGPEDLICYNTEIKKYNFPIFSGTIGEALGHIDRDMLEKVFGVDPNITEPSEKITMVGKRIDMPEPLYSGGLKNGF